MNNKTRLIVNTALQEIDNGTALQLRVKYEDRPALQEITATKKHLRKPIYTRRILPLSGDHSNVLKTEHLLSKAQIRHHLINWLNS